MTKVTTSGLPDPGREEPLHRAQGLELGPGGAPAGPAHGTGLRGPRAARGEPPHVEGRLEEHALVHQEARGLRPLPQARDVPARGDEFTGAVNLVLELKTPS